MPFNCVLLAAGYASRLGELVSDRPKALLPYKAGTILSHLFDHLERLPDLNEICIVANDSFKEHFVAWLASRTSSKRIHLVSNGIIREEDAKGANRDAWFALEQMGWQDVDVLIIGSDNVVPQSLNACAQRFVTGNESVVAVCDYKSKERVKKLAVPVLDETGHVVEIAEKPSNPKTAQGCPLIYFIKAQDLHHLQSLAGLGRDNIGHLLELLCRHERLAGHLFGVPIIDIGTPDDYEYALALDHKRD